MVMGKTYHSRVKVIANIETATRYFIEGKSAGERVGGATRNTAGITGLTYQPNSGCIVGRWAGRHRILKHPVAFVWCWNEKIIKKKEKYLIAYWSATHTKPFSTEMSKGLVMPICETAGIAEEKFCCPRNPSARTPDAVIREAL